MRARLLALLWFAFLPGAVSAQLEAFNEVPIVEGKDVIWVPTPDGAVDRMLLIARVAPGDLVVDLGSGDGKIVIAAAKRFGARGRGVEFSPDLVEVSRRNARIDGVADRARFVQGDLFEADFRDATVVTLYLLTSINLKLRPKLLDMRPGTRVVSTFSASATGSPTRRRRSARARSTSGSCRRRWPAAGRSTSATAPGSSSRSISVISA